MTLEKLYLEAARVARLIEDTDLHIDQMVKTNGKPVYRFNPATCAKPEFDNEFALGVVEGKPVFKGDVLWNKTLNMKFIAEINTCAGIYSGHNGSGAVYADCSWNPPKPRTVMVELTVEDAEWLKLREDKYEYKTMNVIAKACRKALEELK